MFNIIKEIREQKSNIIFEEIFGKIFGKKFKNLEIKHRKAEIKNSIEGLKDKFEKMILKKEKK